MELVLIGLGLGLAAGVSPGPLLTLVVSSTLARGFGAGLRVALAPVLTDAPIIVLAILVLQGSAILVAGLDWRPRRLRGDLSGGWNSAIPHPGSPT